MLRVTAIRNRSLAAVVWLGAALAFIPAAAAQQADPERGAVIGETCLGCHGIENARNPYPAYRVPKLGGQHEQALYLALVEYSERRRSHPTMFAQAASMPDQDLRDVAAWFAAAGGPEEGSLNESNRFARGQELAAVCAACHGQRGIGNNPMWPSLAGQHEDYLFHSMRQYVTGERTEPVMVGLMQEYSEEDMRHLAAFYAAQPGLFTPRIADFR